MTQTLAMVLPTRQQASTTYREGNIIHFPNTNFMSYSKSQIILIVWNYWFTPLFRGTKTTISSRLFGIFRWDFFKQHLLGEIRSFPVSFVDFRNGLIPPITVLKNIHKSEIFRFYFSTSGPRGVSKNEKVSKKTPAIDVSRRVHFV